MKHQDDVHPYSRPGSLNAVSLTVSFTRMNLALFLPAALMTLFLVAAAVSARPDPGRLTLMCMAPVGYGAIAIAGMSPGVLVQGGRLSVRGREESGRDGRWRRAGGSVDLTRLVNVKSVSLTKSGRVHGRGLALDRSLIWLKDAEGCEALFPAWGWSQRPRLQGVLRSAVITSHAKMDPMTCWRLGFRTDRGARINWVRRWI